MNLQRIIGLKNPDAIGARSLNRFTRAPELTRGFGNSHVLYQPGSRIHR